jgi:hypothetical protein
MTSHPCKTKVTNMTASLPDYLQPTAADIARDKQLAAQAEAIKAEMEADGAGRVKVNTESYNSVTFGADGQVLARITNGVSQMSRTEEAVARAQSAANAEIQQMEKRLQKLTHDRDEFDGYDNDGKPKFLRAESDRKLLDKQARELRLGMANQMRLNERRWRNEAAPFALQEERDMITAADLAKELEAKGRFTRIQHW